MRVISPDGFAGDGVESALEVTLGNVPGAVLYLSGIAYCWTPLGRRGLCLPIRLRGPVISKGSLEVCQTRPYAQLGALNGTHLVVGAMDPSPIGFALADYFMAREFNSSSRPSHQY